MSQKEYRKNSLLYPVYAMQFDQQTLLIVNKTGWSIKIGGRWPVGPVFPI
jgi:hypothetical protein